MVKDNQNMLKLKMGPYSIVVQANKNMAFKFGANLGVLSELQFT